MGREGRRVCRGLSPTCREGVSTWGLLVLLRGGRSLGSSLLEHCRENSGSRHVAARIEEGSIHAGTGRPTRQENYVPFMSASRTV